MRRARDPIDRVPACGSKDVFVHFSARWEIELPLHALFESNATHSLLISSRLADLSVDSACSLAEKIVLQGYMTGVAR